MGSSYPNTMVAMRALKAEGGWAVVCTEETDFHPSSDILPIVEGRLWDAGDVRVFARMTEAIHAHGSLAGIELTHTGHRDPNLYSREVPLSVSDLPVEGHALALRRRGLAGAGRGLRQAPDHQAGGRRGTLHLARCAAPRTRPPARSGAAPGTPSATRRRVRRARCWWSGPAPGVSRIARRDR